MERDTFSVKFERLAVPVVIAAAAVLRFVGLGASSLTQNEAEAALSALDLFTKGSGSPLLYTLPTALIFRMFGDSEFTARLFPALAGIVLVLVPLFLRKQIGSRKAVLLAFLFAVDPVLLFWSKRADALLPAVAFAGLAAVLFRYGKNTSGAGFLLAALCGGDRAIPALIVFLAYGVVRSFINKRDPRTFLPRFLSKKEIAAVLGIFLLAVTLFGVLPGGAGAFFSGIFDSFKPAPGWAYPGIAAYAAALIVYCGFPLLLFLTRCVREKRLTDCLLSFAFICLFLFLRGIMAMPWIAAFLWCVSADMLLSAVELVKDGMKGFTSLCAACAAVGAWAFFYFRLVEVFNQQNGNMPVQLTWNGTTQTLPLTRTEAAALLTLASVLIILLIVKILLGFSDSAPIREGIVCGILVIASWGFASNIWNTGGFDRIGDHPAASHRRNSLLLLNGNYSGLTDTALPDVLEETLRKHGDSADTEFGLDLIDDPILNWMLRKQTGILHAADTGAGLSGIELILDRSGNSYADNGFMGTVMGWKGTFCWDRLSLIDWGKWLIFGDGPAFQDAPLTLWVRGDYVISND